MTRFYYKIYLNTTNITEQNSKQNMKIINLFKNEGKNIIFKQFIEYHIFSLNA